MEPLNEFMAEQQQLCISNPQELLGIALSKKNIHYFKSALSQSGVDPMLADQEGGISIFEKCCQTPGHAEFIRACLRWGIAINEVNDSNRKTPINFAVESADADNIRALLENSAINIDHALDAVTPIQHTVGQLTNDNFDRQFECVRLLVDHQADVNIADERGMTPILSVAKSRRLNEANKRHLIEYILDNATVDLDLHRDGESRKVLMQKYGDLTLPPVVLEKDRIWDWSMLFDALRNEKEDRFRQGFPLFMSGKSSEEVRESLAQRTNGRTLLTMAISSRMNRAVELLLRAGADVHDYRSAKQSDDEVGPLRSACINGQYAILQMLLRSSGVDINRSPVLIDVIKHIGKPIPKRFARSSDYNRCFDILINEKKIDLNLKDNFGNTALHTAVHYNNKPVIRELLSRGAYIGSKNTFNRIAIEDIDPSIIESHLDSCIRPNDRRTGDDQYELHFDYTNLVPSKYFQKSSDNRKFDEMRSIEYLATSSDHKHLVKHPLIASFLYLKWHRCAPVFYFNFACFLIFCLSMIPYIVLYYGKPTSSTFRGALYTIALLSALYVFLREVVQFIMSPGPYLRKYENYLEIALISMSAVILSGIHFEEETLRTIAAVTILLVVGELFILTGSLPVLSFTTHLVMLRTVAKTFLRSLMLYSIMLVAFALCFYTLLSKEAAPKEDSGLTPKVDVTAGTEEEEEGDFNSFSNPGLALVKTLVMLTGEFDASDIKFESVFSSYIIFVIFVFLFSSVLFNLLNGLAVSDTQIIKSEAELTHFIYRSEMLSKYEQISLGKGNHKYFNIVFDKISSGQMSLFPDYLPAHKIIVSPNQGNRVTIPPRADTAAATQFDEGPADSRTKRPDVEHGVCVNFRQCTSMEPKIVKYARAVLEKTAADTVESGSNVELSERIQRLETKIDGIVDNIALVSEKLDILLSRLS